MGVESAADRAEFVNKDDFGAEATFTLAPLDPVEGIFDAGFEAIEVGAGAGIGSTKPQFECVESSLPVGLAQDDTVAISGTTYVVTEIMPDGTGMVVLMLDEQ